jgi:enamine deaminase RidA (YjgF/YER057c/UK114 family)
MVSVKRSVNVPYSHYTEIYVYIVFIAGQIAAADLNADTVSAESVVEDAADIA